MRAAVSREGGFDQGKKEAVRRCTGRGRKHVLVESGLSGTSRTRTQANPSLNMRRAVKTC